MEIKPIGTFFGEAVYKYDAPRQGRLFAGHPGKIVLNAGCNFEMALRDLEGFERIWVLFQFHENEGWRPTTRPPVPPKGKDRVGTFASRSPYRPNPIGLSCVRLLKIEGLTLYVDEADLLNESPIIDIKPYIPMADAFPDAKAGWVEEQDLDLWEIDCNDQFEKMNRWICENSEFDLLSFVKVQLAHGPLDETRRRITLEPEWGRGIVAYRTFRIAFIYDEKRRHMKLTCVMSGYSAEDLKENAPDKYGDKQLHRDFLKKFRS